jgi:hypothetical protein
MVERSAHDFQLIREADSARQLLRRIPTEDCAEISIGNESSTSVVTVQK